MYALTFSNKNKKGIEDMNGMNRREFLGALAAFGAFGAARPLFAAPGFKGARPNLVLGVLSDIHLSLKKNDDGSLSFAGEEMFKKALLWYRERGVDGVLVCGDMADRGTIEELEAVSRAWYSVFPDGKAPDGRRVEQLFVYGNHDYEGYRYGGKVKAVFGEKYFDHAIGKDLAAAWKKCFHEDYSPVWRKEINGYSVIGAHWIQDRCRAAEEKGACHAAGWFEKNGASLDPSKPFFYLQHPPPKGTCHCDWVWGHDNGLVTEALSKFRNAVAFSGHSHASINDERAIWQGAFTSIGAGSLKYTGLEYGDVKPFGRENDAPVGNLRGGDPFKIMGKMKTGDGHQGMIVSVYDDRMEFDRRDFEDLGRLGENWVVPLPAADPMPFTVARRAAASIPPQFPEGAALEVRKTTGRNRGGKGVKAEKVPVLEITIPPANGKAGARALDYAIKIGGENGAMDERCVFAEAFYRSESGGKANVPTVCKLPMKRLKAKGKLKIDVFARNSFGKAGTPITIEFAG